jgi:8-oxo-dGTP pyrophosphatase MutT (NUDIX family)
LDPSPPEPLPAEPSPWRTLATRLIYTNPWMTVREDRVLRPDGREGIYGVMDARPATGVVALTPEQEVWLVGQWRYPTGNYSWEIIEGGADPGEPPEDAARRELLEEAGLTAREWELLGGEVHLSNCITAERAWIYLARGLTLTSAPTPEATERLQLRRVPLVEALRRVDSGEIVDAVSVIGLLRAARRLGVG